MFTPPHMADISPHAITSLEALAIILLTDAETPDDQLFAATIALQALDAKQRGAKYGPRGPYDQQKAERFFDHLLHISSAKIFKTWFHAMTEVGRVQVQEVSECGMALIFGMSVYICVQDTPIILFQSLRLGNKRWPLRHHGKVPYQPRRLIVHGQQIFWSVVERESCRNADWKVHMVISNSVLDTVCRVRNKMANKMGTQ
ncbi:uncharacterized protein F5147DRAFT_404996 [Suillus discolor]|uniref:Uncharacterized protein n=1 Tax=Suillus discolor TaxID=1912936 RepID=A0A9P7EYE3_9AGAM|nr:uncharacterized protein F5147DRAFT_404996 [Suillus discolor]KAG2095149.1 hypothetical protein F5147DRAFT_404996 [Suillus discolor]